MRFLPHHQNRRVQPTEDPNPSGLCQCGCGRETQVATRTRAERGVFRGHHLRFIRGHWMRKYDPGYVVDPQTGCWEWTGAMRGGYGVLHQGGASVAAHRVIYERYRGSISPGLDIDHLCRNPSCVNPDHLEPVTRAENVRRGLRSRYSAEDVFQIRELATRPGGLPPKEIAAIYGMPMGTIYGILRGEAWRGVGDRKVRTALEVLAP